jgi:hypothetical protein
VYSCPACRAVVRDTRPNATLSTLLDMFLQAHPDKGKTAQEKLDMDKTYKPGDNVIPPVDLGQVSDDDDEEEQQMLAQARELSLDDVGLRSRSTASEHQMQTHRTRRRNDSPRSAQVDALSHQSSIRSLLSQSDVDLGDMEDEIMRHIIDHGLLDGVDLNNLTPEQEDAITDSIAQAYRSRRRQDRRDRHHNRDRSAARPSPRPSAARHSPHSSSHRQSPSTSAHRHSPSSSAHRRTTSTTTTTPNPHASSLIDTQPSPARRRATSANRSHRVDTTSNRHRHLAPESVSRPSNHSSPALPLFPQEEPVTASAPSISCSRCEKSDIQYSLHYKCDKCSGGNFNLCLGCYRAGKGCLNWFGFGRSALTRYRPQAASGSDYANHDPPHVLSARRYDQSTTRLELGLFCDGCQAFANACYWHCNTCNDGAWGYCNVCVQQGKHCTHPLASAAYHEASNSTHRHSPSELYPPPLTPTNSAFHFAVSSTNMPVLPHVSNPSSYVAINLTSYCDICHYSIPPSYTRFHCNTCNKGNYDICNFCYHSIVNTGKIARENGPSGWRRCLRSHRMSVVGYEDREYGPHRIVVHDMIGGWALKEIPLTSTSTQQDGWRWKENDGTAKTTSVASSSSKLFNASPHALPPSGGIGLKVQALWSYFPGDGVKDELSFPRHAIITEVENINGDWFWGVYCGSKGLFPGNYVRVV